MKKGVSSNPIAYILVATALFFAVNIIGGLSLNRYEVDFTEGGLFTLSEGSYKIIEASDEPITFRFFFSNKLANGYPSIKSYASRITGLLEEYQSASDGRIKVQVIDPEPLTDDEDLAISYGLKGAQIDNEGTKIYFGLVATNSTDESRLIPIFHFDREKFTEYDLTRIISDLSGNKKPTVGVLSALPIDTPSFFGIPGLGGGKSWIILEQMRQLFKVLPVKEDDKTINPDIDVLMVAQPRELTDDVLYAIDQFILKGGRAVFFLDPNAENKGGTSPDKDGNFDPKINTLLKAWGLKVDPSHIIGDRLAARTVVSADSDSGQIDYIGWLSMREQNINREHIISSSLKSVNFGSAGAVEQIEDIGIEFEPLITTSERTMKIPTGNIKGKPDPKKLLSEFVSEDKKYHLAARISGIANSAFPKKASTEGHIAKSEEPINVIIVADTDLMRDEVWARAQDFEGYRVIVPNADNSGFVINSLDFMGGSQELISLRGRGTSSRPFTVVEKLKHEAEEKYLAKETQLKDNLAETEKKLAELQKKGEEGDGHEALIYRARQQREIKRFTEELMEDKKELRRVQHSLRQGIDRLGGILKFINIGLMPLLIIIFAISVAIYRSKKRAL